MNDSIRVERKERRVEVNDQGDYIVLPLDDQAFVPALLDLMNDFKECAAKQADGAASLADGDAEKAAAIAKLNLEMCSMLAARVDRIFGEGSCMKIFGVAAPSLFAFTDFFDQLAPIVRRIADAESKASRQRVKKYSEKYKKVGKGAVTDG